MEKLLINYEIKEAQEIIIDSLNDEEYAMVYIKTLFKMYDKDDIHTYLFRALNRAVRRIHGGELENYLEHKFGRITWLCMKDQY